MWTACRCLKLVGLPDAAVKESRERVRAAMSACQMTFPVARLTLNLAPADVRKEGPAYDLPIALAILSRQWGGSTAKAMAGHGGGRRAVALRQCDGRARRAVDGHRGEGERTARDHAARVRTRRRPPASRELDVLPVAHLSDAIAHLQWQKEAIEPLHAPGLMPSCWASGRSVCDFADVRGQKGAKRALEIAAAGGHNVLMIGPPGSGKTMMARCLPGILPDMTLEEALEVTRIHSAAGTLAADAGLMRRTALPRARITRSSAVALVGGGSKARPGEI